MMKPLSAFENSRTVEPSRSLKKGKYGKHIVHFPSLKNRKVVVCESELEADFCVWLEYEANVVEYAPQPGTFSLALEGAPSRYTPDFQITYDTGEIRYIEVKPDHIFQDAGYLRKIDEFKRIAEQHGYSFGLVTERDIRIQPKLRNLQNLYNRLHLVTDVEVAYALDSLKSSSTGITLRTLLSSSFPPSVKSIAKGVFTRLISADLDQPFTLDSRITYGLVADIPHA
jgi:hypothetical protein